MFCSRWFTNYQVEKIMTFPMDALPHMNWSNVLELTIKLTIGRESQKVMELLLGGTDIYYKSISIIYNFINWTIKRKEITRKKFFFTYVTHLTGGLLLKMLKYLKVLLNVSEFSHLKEIVESWLVYINKFHESSNVSWQRKYNILSASSFFLLFRTLMRRKA